MKKNNADNGNRRVFWIALAAVMVLSVLMAVRSAKTASLVLSDRETVVAASASGGGQYDLEKLAHRDSLLAAAEAAKRDPFRAPVRRVRRTVKAPVVKRIDPPTLKALIYDHVNPTARLRLGEDNSGWLKVGDTFKGWKVTEITSNSVRIAQGGKNLVLP